MSAGHPSADAGISPDALMKPFRWELRPGDPLAGVVASAGEANTEEEAREALARALVTAQSLPTWLEATGSVHAASPDGSTRELERLRWTRTAVPLGVALTLVTGRRVARPEHEALLAALLDHLARGHCLPERSAPLDAPQVLSIVRARAGALFPALADESADGVDAPAVGGDAGAREGAWRAWLEAREARYGPTVPLRLDAGR